MTKAFSFLLCLAFLVFFIWVSSSSIANNKSDSPRKILAHKNFVIEKTRAKAGQAKLFIKQRNYNDQICFLIDMSEPSSKNRFFIYDLKKDTLQNAGLVTHGNCFQSWLEGRRYGNKIGCGCTSLGRYKVGYAYHGKFGLSFKLYGLDSTNSNAFARTVVLHSHDCVPEIEVDYEICQSNGCTTVAPGFLQQLKPMIENSKKPVLLWVYE